MDGVLTMPPRTTAISRMNKKFKELTGDQLEWCIVYPMVGLAYCLIYLDKFLISIQLGYYKLFGIPYIMQPDKFNKYPLRLDK